MGERERRESLVTELLWDGKETAQRSTISGVVELNEQLSFPKLSWAFEFEAAPWNGMAKIDDFRDWLLSS